MRLRADIWVSAYLRRCAVEGASAVLRKRGAAAAGAIFVQIDCLDGRVALFGPAPQSLMDDGGERRWTRVHAHDWIDPLTALERLKREMKFDPDLWIVDVEDQQGRNFLDLVA
jgi:hypothetical protein